MNQPLLLAVLCLGIFPCVLSYTLLAPLLPGELIRRDLQQVYAGVIMGFYTVVSTFSGPIVNMYIYPRFGYMPVFAVGVITTGLCIVLTGACYYLFNNTLFIIANILIRAVEGVGMALIFQTSKLSLFIKGYTLASIAYKQRFARVLPFLSFANACGVATGPPMAGALYSVFGYPGPFFILGICVVAYGTIVIPLLGSKFRILVVVQNYQKSQVTYKDFWIKRSLISLIGVIVAYFATLYYQPILAGKLELHFNFTSDHTAYFYAIFTVSNFFANFLFTIFPLQTRLLFWSTFAAINAIIAALLMGPSSHLGLPNSLTLIAAGTALMGINTQILLLSMLILTLQPLYQKFPQQIQGVSRLFGAYRQVCAGFIYSVTPFYSSSMTSLFSYETTCESVAIILVIFITVFLTIQLSHKKPKSDLTEPLLCKQNS